MAEAPRTAARAATPQRSCVACRRVRAKKQLLRLVASPTGVRFDRRQRLDGRGAYICPDPDCITKAADRGGRAVRRALRGASEDEVRAALTQARSPHRTMRSEHA